MPVNTQARRPAVANRTSGPILGPLIAFSIPILLTNLLNLLFNAADTVVIGQFGSENAVGAVGSTGVIISLIVMLFTGLSAGATTVLSNEIGAGDSDLSDTVHTAFTMGLLLGVLSAAVGLLVSRPFLQLLGTPEEILDKALLYLRIYFIGQPGFMLYSFSRAILISTGDTKSPLYYLMASGAINVGLNLLLVCVFGLDVAGVAIATITSQLLSGVLTTRKLCRQTGDFRLDFRRLRIHKNKARKILRMGLPYGIQNSVFSIAGLLVQSSVNSLGTVVVNGNSAANSINMFAFQAMAAFSQGAMTFAAQNYGAGKYSRLNKVFGCTLLCQMVMGVGITVLALSAGDSLLRIYLPDSPESVEAGLVCVRMLLTFSFLSGLQDSASNMLRGIDRSTLPMVTTIVGNCVLRIVWVLTIFAWVRPRVDTLTAYAWLIVSSPVTWGLTALANLIIYFALLRGLTKRGDAAPAAP